MCYGVIGAGWIEIKEITDGTIREVASFYELSESIKATARHFGYSHHKVQKMLVTAGYTLSPLQTHVMELYASGMSEGQIAEALRLSSSAVNAYLPYSKGVYLGEFPTENALRIRKCREKKEAKE